jgi:flagellar biosynthesis protein FlhB
LSDAEEKPFEPSAEKLREARKKGQVAPAGDLPLILASMAAAVCLWLFAAYGAQQVRQLFSDLFTLALADPQAPGMAASAVRLTAWRVLGLVVPLFVLVAVVGLGVRFLLVGPVFSMHTITPDFNRLNPAKGLKNLFSRDNLFALAKSVLILGLLLAVLLPWLRSSANTVAHLGGSAWAFVVSVSRLLSVELTIGLVLLLALAAVDSLYRNWSFRRGQRMDMKDLRDEYKQQEGSPEVKSERRSQHREMSQK